MADAILHYEDYEPLYINGVRDQARRYVRASDPNDIISVRQFQKNAHLEAQTLPTRIGKRPRKISELKAELAARKAYSKTQRKYLRDIYDLSRYYYVQARIAEGQGLNSALQSVGLSRDVFDRINEQEQGRVGRVYDRTGKRIVGHAVSEQAYKAVWAFPLVDQNGTPIPFYIEVGPTSSSLMGQYWHAVKVLEETGNPDPLNALAGKYVVDIEGTVWILPDANFIVRWLASQSDEFKRDFEKTLYIRRSGQSLKRTAIAA
jgi:hypothetical protein